MSTSISRRPFLNARNELFVMYLDDSQNDLTNFEKQVNSYNTEVASHYENPLKVRYKTTTENNIVEQFLKDDDRYQVFICDHNMPERKGLEFIKYLKPELPEVIFVLYSAIGNIDSYVTRECAKDNILIHSKTEEISTLIEKLVLKYGTSEKIKPIPRLARPSPDPTANDLYDYVADDVLKDLKSIDDPNFRIRIEGEYYRPDSLIREIENRSPIGTAYLKNYINGLKFFKNRSIS